MKQNVKKRLIVVLGMHRSGTSAITRGLQALGVDLGQTLLPPRPDNEKGFWEDADVNQLNIDLLRHLHQDWHTLVTIDPSELDRKDLAPFRLRAIDLLRRKMQGVSHFGLKDPRIAVLLPYWKKIFEHVGTSVGYVIAVRNPISVARSLQTRNGLTPEHAHYLWLQYVVPSVLNSKGTPRVVVDYDLVVENPTDQLHRIAKSLELRVDAATGALEEYSNGFLEDRLRHTRYQLEDLQLDPAVPAEVRSAYACLNRVARDVISVESPEVRELFSQLAQRLTDLSPIFRYIRAQESSNITLQQTVAERDSQLAALQGAAASRDAVVAERDGQVATLQQILTERDIQLTALHQAVSDRDTLIAGRDGQIAALHEALTERENRLGAVKQTLAQRDDVIADRETQLVNLENTLTDRESQLALAQESLAHRDALIVAERDEKISTLHQALGDRESQLAAVNQSVAQRDAVIADRDLQLASLQQMVTERDGRLAAVKEAFAQRDDAIAYRETQLTILRNALAEHLGELAVVKQSLVTRDSLLGERDQQLAMLRQELIERDGQIATLQHALVERDAHAATLRLTIEQRETALADRAGKIALLQQSVSDSEARLAGFREVITLRDEVITERDGQIAALNQAVAEGNIQIVNLTQAVAECDAQIATLNQSLAERDDRIAKLGDAVAERDGRITTLDKAVAERDQALVSRDYTINEYTRSRSWRVTRPLRYLGRQLRNISLILSASLRIVKALFNAVLNVPFAVSRWGVRGFADRILRRYREGGFRTVLGRSNALYLQRAQYASNRQIVDRSQNDIVASSAERAQVSDVAKPPTRSSSSSCTIAYVINDHDLMTQQYRVVNYSEALLSFGYQCTVIRENTLVPDSDIDADLLVLNRIVWTPNVDALIRRFNKCGHPVIFDIDDFVFDSSQIGLLRATNGYGDTDRQRTLFFMNGVSKTMDLCDAVTVSTFALKLEVEKRGLPSYVLPNNIGKKQGDLAKRIAQSETTTSVAHEKIRVGYFSGTKTHEEDFAQCSEALRALLLECPNVELLLVGHLDLPTCFNELEDRIIRKPLMLYDDMLKELAKVDINLAPLELGNAFTDCKSELKIFEAALFGIPTVASATSTFAATIAHEKTGFLATTTDEWHSALIRLVRDRELRRRVGEAARSEIATRYDIGTAVEEAKAIYGSAISRSLRRLSASHLSSVPAKDRPLITVVSILYRKAREIRYFLEALRRQDFPGRYEIILVNDQTPDESIPVVEDFKKWMSHITGALEKIDIRILTNERNVGNCGSRNKAIKEARGDIVIVIDADCMLNRTYLSEHYHAFLNGDCDVAIGPMNIETNGSSPYSVLGRHEADHSLYLSTAQLQDEVNLDSFVNCITRNFSIRREFLLNTLGEPLFDEQFSYSSDPNSGFGWEDVEMGCRLFKAGARIRFLRNTFSIHVSHPSTTDERTKPLRSLKNFRRLHELHPELNMLARQWATRTYQAILDWATANGLSVEGNPDHAYLEAVFSRYRRSSTTIPRQRPLRVLTYRWHCPHQYELYRGPHQFTLVTGAGTTLCDKWEWGKRPLPRNARFLHIDQVNPRDYDLAVLHFDENVLHPEKCHGKVPLDWGSTLRWFRSNVPIPKVAICHGTPQFAGQYDPTYTRPDLGQVDEISRAELVDLFQDILVVCNSYQAQSEWGFKHSTVIWHGFAPTDYPLGPRNRAVLAMLYPALADRPHYNGLFVFEKVKELVNGLLDISTLQVPAPSPNYVLNSNEWAEAKFRNYAREIAQYSVYLNPTLRSPMPRSRGEAMMAGLVTVSMRNHDVDSFIRNGVNGFFADSAAEMGEQLLFLSRHPSTRAAMAAASRRTALDVFNQDRYLAKWSKIFTQYAT